MNEKEKLYLVLVEADKIQSYVFQSNKLTENIGASAFVADYNSVDASQCLYDTGWNGNIEKDKNGFRFTDKSILSNNLDYELIYSGGGNVKIVLQCREKADTIARDLVRLYRENTVSAEATWVIYEFDPNQPFDSVMQKAEMQMRANKLSKEMPVQLSTIPHMKLCHSCGRGAAIESFQERNQKEYLCQSCSQKREKGRRKEKDIFLSFYPLLSSKLNPILSSIISSNKIPPEVKFDRHDFLPKDFDNLADPRNFIAVVVIDGNRFGKKIQELLKGRCAGKQDLEKAIATLRKFSLRVDELADECLAEAVSEAFKDDLTTKPKSEFQTRFIREVEIQPGVKQQKFLIPFRPIILGGDDLTFVCAADRAFDIALKFVRLLRQHSAGEVDLFGQNGLSCSIGIAIVKRHFPFRSAHRLAEDLLASAKKKNREYLHKDSSKRDFSAIDFSVVTTSSVDELGSRREREFLYSLLNGQEYCLTSRPYLIADEQCRISDEERREEISSLIENAKKLQHCLARNKFKALREILRTGKANSEYKWLEMTSRLTTEKRRNAKTIEDFYGGLWCNGTYANKDVLINNFTDMVEIYEYLGNLQDGG